MNPFIATIFVGVFLFAIGPASASDVSGAPGKSGSASTSVLGVSNQYESYERQLEAVRALSENAAVVKQNARTLFQLGKSAPAPVSDMMLEAACAALIVAGDNKAYKAAQGALRNSRDFENRILYECSNCHGNRQIEESCRECRGSGRCPIPNCSGGSRYLPHVGNVPCPTCRGSGKCQDCNGSGRKMVDCRSCGGAGQKIDRNAAKDFYRERIEDAKNECRLHEVVACRDVPGYGYTIEEAEENALVKAAENVHGPQGAERQKRLGRYDKTIVKTYKVKSRKETDSGDFEVVINALVAKVLQNGANSGERNTSIRPPSYDSRPRERYPRPSRPAPASRSSYDGDSGDPFSMRGGSGSGHSGGDSGDPFSMP